MFLLEPVCLSNVHNVYWCHVVRTSRNGGRGSSGYGWIKCGCDQQWILDKVRLFACCFLSSLLRHTYDLWFTLVNMFYLFVYLFSFLSFFFFFLIKLISLGVWGSCKVAKVEISSDSIKYLYVWCIHSSLARVCNTAPQEAFSCCYLAAAC